MNTEWPTQKTEAEKTKSIEQELSSEQVKQIMAKVQDIDKSGTAYSATKFENLASIFQNGLLGSKASEGFKTQDIKSEWATNIRKGKRGLVFFNIIGVRNFDLEPKPFYDGRLRKIEHETFFSGELSTAVIFDLDAFKGGKTLPEDSYGPKEGESLQKNREFRYGMESKRYANYIPSIELARENFEKNKDGFESIGLVEFNEKEWWNFLPIIPYDYGFSLSFRVPPRLFKGIVFKLKTELNDNQNNELIKLCKQACIGKREHTPDGRTVYWESVFDESKGLDSWRYPINMRITLDSIARNYRRKIAEEHRSKEKKIKEIVFKMKEAWNDRSDLLIPIYDEEGALLWPKQMSYDEVKMFVAERDAKNTNTNKEEK